MPPVDVGCADRASSLVGRAEVQAHHVQRSLTVSDQHFAKKHRTKAVHMKAVALARDAGIVGVYLLYDRAKKRSIGPWWIDVTTCVKGILSYFAESRVIFKGQLCFGVVSNTFEEFGVKFDVDRIAGDSEIFKLAADHGDEAFRCFIRVLGVQAGDEAVGSENVENVQAFYRGVDQSIVAIVLGLMAAGDVRVTALERDPFAVAETINVSVAVAADGRQGRGGLRIDQFVKGTSETSAEGVSAGVIVKRSEVFGFILGGVRRVLGIGSLWGHGQLLFELSEG